MSSGYSLGRMGQLSGPTRLAVEWFDLATLDELGGPHGHHASGPAARQLSQGERRRGAGRSLDRHGPGSAVRAYFDEYRTGLRPAWLSP
jgi:hypothetical protein